MVLYSNQTGHITALDGNFSMRENKKAPPIGRAFFGEIGAGDEIRTHDPNLGNGSIIRPGEIQRMSAGTGIRHSEMNASTDEPVHFLQIWIVPEILGGEPSYERVSIDQTGIEDRFGIVAGPSTEEALVSLNSDTRVYLASLRDETVIEHKFSTGRAGFIQIVDGMVEIEEERLTAGDGLQFGDQEICTVIALSDAKVILFDLA